MSFTEDLNQIQEIVKKLEGAPLPLEEALEEFERGVALIRRCQQFLEKAEQRVALLGENGAEAEWEPLEEEDAERSNNER